MAQKNDKGGIGRRGFFGAAAVATVATTGVLTSGARPVLAQESVEERVKVRYQETDHVKAFYETNRYYKGA
ncbi:MAG: hypothetical protein ACTS3R_13755 [Inquilinaceae bacterium]